jgi:predicted amidohydrolase YtcJ
MKNKKLKNTHFDHVAISVRDMDREIGSIEFGKKADFCVLEADPLEIDPMELKDLPVWGTVFTGEPNPAKGN